MNTVTKTFIEDIQKAGSLIKRKPLDLLRDPRKHPPPPPPKAEKDSVSGTFCLLVI
jgi:hypothetical protein